MQNYEAIDATFDKIVSGVLEHGSRKFFILVNGSDGVKYQVKLNEVKQRHNVNEFISHYIGSCSDIPLVSGAFLELDILELKKIQEAIDSMPKNFYKQVDFSLNKENLFFGVEWKQHINKIDDERELISRVGETSNKTSLFSLYTFDQFTKNYDRHLGNHLVVKEGRSKKYYLIDFDRIFASTNWFNLPTDYKCFVPFVAHPSVQPYHSFLMYIVSDATLKFVHSYAGKLQSIKTESIKDMCDIISLLYNITSIEILNIFRWFEYRRQEIVMECQVNEKYFPRIKKGLYSVSR